MKIEPTRLYQPDELVTGLGWSEATVAKAFPWVKLGRKSVLAFNYACHDDFTLTHSRTDVKQQPEQQPHCTRNGEMPMITRLSKDGGQGRNRTADTKQACFTPQITSFRLVSARFGHTGTCTGNSNSNQMATGCRKKSSRMPALAVSCLNPWFATVAGRKSNGGHSGAFGGQP